MDPIVLQTIRPPPSKLCGLIVTKNGYKTFYQPPFLWIDYAQFKNLLKKSFKTSKVALFKSFILPFLFNVQYHHLALYDTFQNIGVVVYNNLKLLGYNNLVPVVISTPPIFAILLNFCLQKNAILKARIIPARHIPPISLQQTFCRNLEMFLIFAQQVVLFQNYRKPDQI